jgi:hypothetical protein
MIGPLTATQRSRLSFSAICGVDEGPPEGRAGERALGAGSKFLQLLCRVAPRLLGKQALEGVLQMPLALLKLGAWPASLDRPRHPAVGIADDSLGLTPQRAEESAPVGRMCARKRLRVPELWLARLVTDRAEDIEGDPPGGKSSTQSATS